MTVEVRNMEQKSHNSTDSRSDTSGTSDERPSHEDICRDFLRNVCKRGRRCKYRHPSANEVQVLGMRHEFTFCHDFQNLGCKRVNCRFVHCTREEEDYYKQTGQLPVRLQQAAALGIGVVPTELPLLRGEVPVCKDFLKGDCKRANRCKYRHISSADFQALEATRASLPDPQITSSNTVQNGVYPAPTYTEDLNILEYGPVASKRRKLDVLVTPTFNLSQPPPPIPEQTAQAHYALTEPNNNQYAHQHAVTNTITIPPPTYRILQTTADYRLVEEENALLRRKVEQLKKKVSDLVATNEVLLEQNARYRSNKAIDRVTTGTPIASVSQVVTPTITPAPAMARSPSGQIGASLTTLRHITLSQAASELVMSQSLQSARLANDLSQNNNIATGMSMVPVSNSMETLVAQPASLSATHITPGSMTQTGSITQPTLVSGPNSHLVSYPIMSHSITQLPVSNVTQITSSTL